MVIDMAHRAIIQNYDINTFMSEVLNSSPMVARHSSVIHLRTTAQGMDGREYCWANPDVQPWGNVLPPQCEKCFSFRPWGKKAVGLGGVPSSISFACGG